MGKELRGMADGMAAEVLSKEFDSRRVSKDDFRRLSELLTEFRWLQACFTSFLPQGSKEYRIHKAKTDELGKLREKCENEATR